MTRSFLKFFATLTAVLFLASHVADADARGRARPQPVRPITKSESVYSGTPAPSTSTIRAPTFTPDAYRPDMGFKLRKSHFVGNPGGREVWESATQAFGAATSAPSKAYVVLLVSAFGEVFATSNYLKSGFRDAPLLTLDPSDLLDSAAFSARVKELLDSSDVVEQATLKLVLDADVQSSALKNIFDLEQQSFRINTAEFRHAELFLKGSDSVFGLERIDRPNPPPRWAAKLNDCCVFTGVPPDFAGWDKLGTVPFDPRRAQVLSLFSDSTTGKALKKRGRPQDITHPSELTGEANDALTQLAHSQPPGTPLIVLGHSIGSVMRIEGQNPVDITFEHLTSIARQAQRPLLLLGCYSAEHFSRPGVGSVDYAAGALNLLRPQEISATIVKAVETSRSFRELNEKLSSESLYIWMSSNFMRDVHDGTARTVRAPLYKKMANGLRSIVGFIFMYLPCTSGNGCGK